MCMLVYLLEVELEANLDYAHQIESFLQLRGNSNHYNTILGT